MLKRFAIVAVLLALPATVLAQDWMGITSDWADLANWSSNPVNEWQTLKASIDPGDVAYYGGTFMPVIDSSHNTTYGFARVRNGAVITQTGGFHKWANGSGDSTASFYMYSAVGKTTALNISGGTHEVDGRMNIGYNGTNPVAAGNNEVNISGTGTLAVLPYTWGTQYDLNINTNSVMTIADHGKLIVKFDLADKIDGYAIDGRIIAGVPGESLIFTPDFDNDLYIVTATPEPASLALLALGGMALIRRRRA